MSVKSIRQMVVAIANVIVISGMQGCAVSATEDVASESSVDSTSQAILCDPAVSCCMGNTIPMAPKACERALQAKGCWQFDATGARSSGIAKEVAKNVRPDGSYSIWLSVYCPASDNSPFFMPPGCLTAPYNAFIQAAPDPCDPPQSGNVVVWYDPWGRGGSSVQF